MSIEFKCSCGKKFRVADEMAGRRARCKRCGNTLNVPGIDAILVESESSRSMSDTVSGDVDDSKEDPADDESMDAHGDSQEVPAPQKAPKADLASSHPRNENLSEDGQRSEKRRGSGSGNRGGMKRMFLIALAILVPAILAAALYPMIQSMMSDSGGTNPDGANRSNAAGSNAAAVNPSSDPEYEVDPNETGGNGSVGNETDPNETGGNDE